MPTLARKYNGFAIAIAWPQTYCKQPGAWYDGVSNWLGISKNNYYKVGHAAVVLINSDSKVAYYFDFGRYHAPFQHGRVRGAITDQDLALNVRPKISSDGNTLINYTEILEALQNNPACHGEGEIQASYCKINFAKAYGKVLEMQKAGPIPYGPFTYGGSNCSRFVRTVIQSGTPNWKHRLKLNYFVPFTPTPSSNVSSLTNSVVVPKRLNTTAFEPLKINKMALKGTLRAPIRDPKIPKNAQWLGGEGAGSWFTFEKRGELIKAMRFSPQGVLECSGYYKNESFTSNSTIASFTITYPSNCRQITLQNTGAKFTLERVASA